jgi:acetolactate synthase regulatory subunit|tara:strand:- start:15 stop:230 length:216 start_codon:yes stop_codon:yes gene_type:complete
MNAKAANKTAERDGENLMCFISTESARPFDTWATALHLFVDNLSVKCVERTSFEKRFEKHSLMYYEDDKSK